MLEERPRVAHPSSARREPAKGRARRALCSPSCSYKLDLGEAFLLSGACRRARSGDFRWARGCGLRTLLEALSGALSARA